MTLVERSDGWEIEGAGKERARIAYAREEQGKLVVNFQKESQRETDELSGARLKS